MDKFFKQFIFERFDYRDTTSEIYISKFLILCLSSVFSVGIHIVLLVLFYLSNIKELVLIGYLSILIYFAMLYLTYVKRSFILSNMIEVLEVVFHTFAIVYFIGANNNTILYLLSLLVLQLVMPKEKLKISILIYSLIAACAVVIVYMQIYAVPIYNISDKYNSFFTFFNTCIAFFVVSVVIYFSNLVKKFAEDYKSEQLARVENKANTDHLTGLYNRRYADMLFHSFAKSKENKPKCVAILDIDDYKLVNDKYGHNIGDTILVNIAKIMGRTLRKTDVLIRWGGEEFLIILDGVSTVVAYNILDKLRTNIWEFANEVPGGYINVSVTIGVSEFLIDNPMRSIGNCDNNLYEGKRTGKNKVVQ